MNKYFLIFVFIFISCAGIFNGRYFYTVSIKDGYDMVNIYNLELIRIDTLKESQTIYVFYYKKKKDKP